MSKVSERLGYHTLEKGIDIISGRLKEKLSFSELFSLVMSGDLKISIYFPKAVHVQKGLSIQDISNGTTPYIQSMTNLDLGVETDTLQQYGKKDCICVAPHTWAVFKAGRTLVDGLWQLSMLGKEVELIEELLSSHLAGGSEGMSFKSQSNDFLLQREAEFAKLKHGNWGYEGDENGKPIPECILDAEVLSYYQYQIVITQSDLDIFLSVFKEHDEPTLHAKERQSYHILIHALLTKLGKGINDNQLANYLETLTKDAECALSRNTVISLIENIGFSIDSKRK